MIYLNDLPYKYRLKFQTHSIYSVTNINCLLFNSEKLHLLYGRWTDIANIISGTEDFDEHGDKTSLLRIRLSGAGCRDARQDHCVKWHKMK